MNTLYNYEFIQLLRKLHKKCKFLISADNGFCVLQVDAFDRNEVLDLIKVSMGSDPWHLPRKRDTEGANGS